MEVDIILDCSENNPSLQSPSDVDRFRVSESARVVLIKLLRCYLEGRGSLRGSFSGLQ
jgi:hypothetical protein